LELDVSDIVQQWVETIGRIELPVLESTHIRLGELAQSPDETDGAGISAAVLPDPMMVLKAMRMGNTGRSRRFAQPVLTVGHAVMLHGLGPSFNQMLGCPVIEHTLDPEIRSGLMAAFTRASHAAFQARDWAVLRLDLNVEEVYIAALLQELGEMALWVVAPEVVRELPALRRRQGYEPEREIAPGVSLDALTLHLARELNLPPLIGSALVSADCEARPRARLVSLARRIARNAEWGWHNEALLKDIEELAATLRLDVDETTTRIHRAAADAAHVRRFPGAVPAAAWLPMLPGQWPEDALETEPETMEAGIAAHPDPFRDAMDHIAAHLDGTLSLHELMQLVLKGMRDGIGLERVVFALLTRDKKHLMAKYVVGAEENAPLKQFRFDLGVTHLFGKMMGKQQAFWLNNEVRPKVEVLLTEDLRRITGAEQFFAMTIAVRGNVIGLFYADRGEGAHPLDSESYAKFKELCTRAATGMEHLSPA
jgi:HD-like signal output (HDOD) protein